MLPTATELNFAKKCKFDLYTLTNLSFADLATHLGMDYDLKAVEVGHFGDQLTSLNWSDDKANRQLQAEGKQESIEDRDESTLPKYSAELNVKHSSRAIFETVSIVKELFGNLNNIIVIEKETFKAWTSQ